MKMNPVKVTTAVVTANIMNIINGKDRIHIIIAVTKVRNGCFEIVL